MEWVVFLIVTSVAGGAILQSIRLTRLKEASEVAHQLERDILRAAMVCGGRITALDVRSHVACTVAHVEAQLRQLHMAGYCESELSADGTHIYVFKAYDDAPMRAQVLEKHVLQIAHRFDGLVRIGQIAMETDLTYAESREYLEKMAANQICTKTAEPDAFRFFPPRAGQAKQVPHTLEAVRVTEHAPLLLHPAPIPIDEDDAYEVDSETGIFKVRGPQDGR